MGKKCEDERVVRVLDGFVGSATYGVHNPSLVNLSRAVVERILCTVDGEELTSPLRPEANAFDELRDIRAAVLKNTCSSKVATIEEFPSLYRDPRKRAIYERAVTSLQSTSVHKGDSIIKVFVKAEKVNFTAKPDPAPRAIQPRGPRYVVSLGRYLKPFEKCVYAGFAATFGYNVVCKGMNAAETANQLWENWSQYDDPVALGLDATRFDQHVSFEALEFEHGWYNMTFNDPHLEKLLRWQLINMGVGYVEGGKVKYKVRGCRASGDPNTSLGNVIIMCSIVLAFFRAIGVDARLANNGDDCVIFCSRKDEHRFGAISGWCERFGFKLTQDPTVDEFEKIQFCQTQPVYTSEGWRMVRNPYTATSKDMVSLLSWNSELEFDRWRGAISRCGSSLTSGVPYWDAFYKRLGGLVDEKSECELRKSGLGYMAARMNVVNSSITPEVRYSFWRAFGMLPDEQLALEELSKPISFADRTPLMFGDVTPLHPLLKV